MFGVYYVIGVGQKDVPEILKSSGIGDEIVNNLNLKARFNTKKLGYSIIIGHIPFYLFVWIGVLLIYIWQIMMSMALYSAVNLVRF